MQYLSSAQNPLIKELCKLQSSRRERTERGLFVLEGLRVSQEAADSGVAIETLFVTQRALEHSPEAVEIIGQKAGARYRISPELARKIADSSTPQGIFCLCRRLDNHLTADKIRKDGHYLAAYSLQDPGNLGTIIRSCEAFGADGLILSSDCPDIYSPKVLRSAMGGIFRLPIYLTDHIDQTVAQLQGKGVPVYGAALTRDARPIGTADFSGGCCVMVGNEGSGLPREMIDRCDGSLIIPMGPHTESLNASVAASIFLWEMFRARERI